MFGFVFGTACLIGLIWLLRRGPHGHGGRVCGRPDWGDRNGWRSGPRAWTRWLFERLDTTPGQERAIRAAVEDFVDRADRARREIGASRADVAQALRADEFGAEALGEALGKHEGALSDLRRAAIDGLAKIHDALEPKQRARLAELIESGAAGRWHGPYRSWI